MHQTRSYTCLRLMLLIWQPEEDRKIIRSSMLYVWSSSPVTSDVCHLVLGEYQGCKIFFNWIWKPIITCFSFGSLFYNVWLCSSAVVWHYEHNKNNLKKKNTIFTIFNYIHLCDGDSLPGFGWWSVGVGQTLSEQHGDLLQLLLSLLHIGILLQHLLQVRAACQIVLVEG